MHAAFKDFWASRTVRFNTYIGTVMAALVPVVVVMDQADWAEIGVEPKWALVLVLVAKALSSAKNVELRAKTDKPLKGRAG